MHGIPDATLRIRTFETHSHVFVEVEDTGAGIEPNTCTASSTPSSPPRPTRSAGEHKGTGLGLAVSYGILQEHGGKITVESSPGAAPPSAWKFPARRPRARHRCRDP